MKRIRDLLQRSFTAVVIVMLLGVVPAPAFAQSATPNTDTQATEHTAPPDNGPTGSAENTFHYNEGTGNWENDYYTYYPATHETVPKQPLEYSCNPETRKWDTNIWQYVASHDAYILTPVSLSVVPEGAIITQDCPAPNPVVSPTTSDQNEAAQGTSEAGLVTDTPTTPPSGGTNITTGITLNTSVVSNATSGTSLVTGNDDVAGVGTGNASATANIFNLLQSQAAFAGGNVGTFTANIQGNVQGDFIIDPATLAQPASVSQNQLNNAKINSVTNGTINNNIVLNAISGDATVKDNDDIGNVTTGDATAIADVINMINSVVSANQSFVGTINIYGDYTGNILMPVDSLNALLGSAGSNTDSTSVTNSSTVDSNSTYNIANNVKLGATSGTATVGNNDDVGSVTSGNAMTNLTILNLTGKQVVAANSLLVFVNVLGNWVGLIMNAPAGSSAAALGGGVSNNTSLTNSSNVNNTENYAINNNITANAKSGDATVENNDDVASVATGNALASVSLANLINSNFSVSNWFGVLFINVFGTWHGNFDVMKAPVVPAITSGSSLPGMGGGGELLKDAKVFAFVPSISNSGTKSRASSMQLTPMAVSNTENTGSGGSTNLFSKATAVLGASSTGKPKVSVSQAAVSSFNYWTIGLLTLGSAGLLFVAVERVRGGLRSRYITKY